MSGKPGPQRRPSAADLAAARDRTIPDVVRPGLRVLSAWRRRWKHEERHPAALELDPTGCLPSHLHPERLGVEAFGSFDVGGGALVGAGAYNGLDAMWRWALNLIPINAAIRGCGHSLGDWTDRWDTWAARATRGDWEETGRETVVRQRTGLKPETPARKVEE